MIYDHLPGPGGKWACGHPFEQHTTMHEADRCHVSGGTAVGCVPWCVHDPFPLVAESRVAWCSICGSLRVDGQWRFFPSGLVLPGTFCPSCKAFCGFAKERLNVCRCCGAAL